MCWRKKGTGKGTGNLDWIKNNALKSWRKRMGIEPTQERLHASAPYLTLAREIESTIKGDLVRGEYDIRNHKATKAPTLNEIWAKYLLPWAQENKKTWQDDEWYYNRHLEPRFGAKALDTITPMNIERMKSELKKSITFLLQCFGQNGVLRSVDPHEI
jgi:hypothetical protein